MPVNLPRVYPILDTAACEARSFDVVATAQAMLDGGARILQFRSKEHLTRQRFEQALAIGEACKAAGAQYVINDRADLARLANAWLHIGQEDLPAEAARRLLPDGVIGLSTHNLLQAQAAEFEPVDYLAFGPMFGTRSKANPDPETGLEMLLQIRALTDRPLVAIGGITRATAMEIWESGAESIAVIGDLLPETGTLDGVRARMKEWQQLAAAAS